MKIDLKESQSDLSKGGTTLLATAIVSYISNTPPNPRSAGTLIRRLPSFSRAEIMRTQHGLNS
jgi:hypothetical protein